MPIPLQLPVTLERLRGLRAGDAVAVTGRIITAREAAHRLLAARPEPRVRAALEGRFLYHCGPVIARGPGGGWRVVAAGASAPVDPWPPELLARYGVRGVIGRRGLGAAARAALRAHGAVYLEPAGGLAVSLARRVVRVHGVHLLDELGVTDAVWDLEVEAFPAVVTLDARGEAAGAGLVVADAAVAAAP